VSDRLSPAHGGAPTPSVTPEASASTSPDRRVVVKGSPFNAEAHPAALDAFITPIDDFYVRSNFEVPRVDGASWRLRVGGLVERPLELSLG
jgi:DMSO/TMAO reductase YedYZ molybdopterin-dependent catalytic subunit